MKFTLYFTTVNKILADLTSKMHDLRELADYKAAQAAELAIQAKEAHDEGARANRVAKKLEELVS